MLLDHKYLNFEVRNYNCFQTLLSVFAEEVGQLLKIFVLHHKNYSSTFASMTTLTRAWMFCAHKRFVAWITSPPMTSAPVDWRQSWRSSSLSAATNNSRSNYRRARRQMRILYWAQQIRRLTIQQQLLQQTIQRPQARRLAAVTNSCNNCSSICRTAMKRCWIDKYPPLTPRPMAALPYRCPPLLWCSAVAHRIKYDHCHRRPITRHPYPV